MAAMGPQQSDLKVELMGSKSLDFFWTPFFYHHLIISSHFLLPVLPNFPVNFLLNISDIAQLRGFLPTPYLVCRVQAKEAMQ